MYNAATWSCPPEKSTTLLEFLGEVANSACLGVEVQHDKEKGREKGAEKNSEVGSEGNLKGGRHWQVGDEISGVSECRGGGHESRH
mmetsp:Transcript_89575/g.179034  ORF Transcript_89575/g.179034 Transcript_89575/m.179034 type:complete len:86 (+) Transcript_89575:212-469(+)